MSPTRTTLLLFVALVVITARPASAQTDVDSLEKWLNKPVSERPEFEDLPFASESLSRARSAEVSRLLWEDHVAQLREQRKQEWDAKIIAIDDLEMKFDFKVFGEKPKTGRRLFISMHGGGGTRARVNEQQWKNQIGLYRPAEGVYLAPRAPNDAWNMWHQKHIDRFFHRIIENAMLFEDVDPNRVYLMGYSAGGDGVYQLAPRMADSLAAAAMMAGHPNGASPANLRNIGFALHMGANDSAYKRNQIAGKWKTRLLELQKEDPDGYQHQVQIHQGLGHWMNRKDAVAVPWMSDFVRDPNPGKVVWRQTGVSRNNFYWLALDDSKTDRKNPTKLVVTRQAQVFDVETAKGVTEFQLRLNDAVADLDQPLVVTSGGESILDRHAKRQPLHIFNSIKAHSDPHRIYSANLDIKLPAAKAK